VAFAPRKPGIRNMHPPCATNVLADKLKAEVSAVAGWKPRSGVLKCKLSPGSFSGDKPPALNFRALLTEGGAERLELARA
jgi:hypothetical protein